MYQVGDRVVYGIHGVCSITGQVSKVMDRRSIQYFVLEPGDQPGAVFYVPSENPNALAKLRPILGKERLMAILKSPRDL